MKYKGGDRVRVKGDLEQGINYGKMFFVDGMFRFSNTIVTIAEIRVMNDGYHIAEDNGAWNWSEEMFEPVVFKKEDLQAGDIILLRCGFLYVFVDKCIGFVSLLEQQIITEWETDTTAKLGFIRSDFKHFANDTRYDVIKIYRKKESPEIDWKTFNFPQDICQNYDLIWKEEKPKKYYTLEEASKGGKRMKYKESNNWYNSPHTALSNAVYITGKSMFEILQLKEFEVEDTKWKS